MKRISYLTLILCALALLALTTLNSQLSTVFAQSTTAFTYQGRLNTGATAANGSYDMTFAVYDANVAGNQIAGPITNSAVAVSNGLFTVSLDFGPSVFTGTNYWVQMAVSPAGAGTFATLVPRQQLTPAPYALSLVSPQATALCPPGSIMAYMGTNAPPGWLLCNGQQVSRTQYAALFAVLGTASGAGDGSTTFNVTDLRGFFLRGVDNGAGQDPDTLSRTSEFTGGNAGDAVGSQQADQFKTHQHDNGAVTCGEFYYPTAYNIYGTATAANVPSPAVAWGNETEYTGYTGPQGGSETRPKNIYVNYIIKY
jgi:microcystin-dependent protein